MVNLPSMALTTSDCMKMPWTRGTAGCLHEQSRFIGGRAVGNDVKDFAETVVAERALFVDDAVVLLVVVFLLTHGAKREPHEPRGWQNQFGQIVDVVVQIEIVDEVHLVACVQHPDIAVFDRHVQHGFVVVISADRRETPSGRVQMHVVVAARHAVTLVEFERSDLDGDLQTVDVRIGDAQADPMLRIQVGIEGVDLKAQVRLIDQPLHAGRCTCR